MGGGGGSRVTIDGQRENKMSDLTFLQQKQGLVQAARRRRSPVIWHFYKKTIQQGVAAIHLKEAGHKKGPPKGFIETLLLSWTLV